jgi:hypothetical protein
MNVRRALAHTPVPDERESADRAWSAVRDAYRDRDASRAQNRQPSRARTRLRAVLVPAIAVAVAAVALSPAGATVGRVIGRALGVPHAARALFSLPAPGRLLVSGSSGTWIVAADGAKRRLGPWRQASWSPRGLYVVAAGGDTLAAVDPHGTVRWKLSRPAVSDPRWFASNGYRIAYLSGHSLRVVAGDGTGDHLLAPAVAHVAAAWRPDRLYEVAYVTSGGGVTVKDADTGEVFWTVGHLPRPRALAWSTDGRELLVVGRTSARVYGANGRVLATIHEPAGVSILEAALSPDGRRLAVVRGGAGEDVVVVPVTHAAGPARRVLSGQGLRQVVWSPNGRWLLASWPAADQWVFVRASGHPGIQGVSRIAEQFTGATKSPVPVLEGWCCTTEGAPG